MSCISISEARAVGLLVAHQRKDNGGGCHCGWNILGASYAEHVARVLKEG